MSVEKTRSLVLYHMQACPYCIKTRRALARLELDIELRDIDQNPLYRQELLSGGGKTQVPCLRIKESGKTRWLYESDDIIGYLTHYKNQLVNAA